jgi:uridine phosphorylase
MTTVNTKGLMLGLLAIGGLISGGAMFTAEQAYAQISNAAVAANSDDDIVTQVNAAEIKQESETKCEAKVSDDDFFQVGDNVNTAANDCDTTQSATALQTNTNEDNDVQVADADACQAIAGLAGANVCDVVVEVGLPDQPLPGVLE